MWSGSFGSARVVQGGSEGVDHAFCQMTGMSFLEDYQFAWCVGVQVVLSFSHPGKNLVFVYWCLVPQSLRQIQEETECSTDRKIPRVFFFLFFFLGDEKIDCGCRLWDDGIS